MLISDIDIVKKYCGGLLWSPSQQRGAVAFNCHAWIPEKKKKCHQLWMRWSRGVLTGVNTGEDTPILWQPQQFHKKLFPVVSSNSSLLVFLSSSSPIFLLQLPCFPKSSWSWGLSGIICNSRTKVGCLTLCFGGGPSYFGRDVFLMHEWLT